MKSRLVFLCNAVKMTRQGLFNAEGLGINFLQFSALPAKRLMTLFLDIEYTSITEAGVHLIEVRFIDCDGKDIIIPILRKEKFPKRGETVGFFIKVMPIFYKYGCHSVEIGVDKHQLAAIPLNIAPFDS